MINGIIDSNQKIVSSGLAVNLDAAQKRSYIGSGTTWTDLSGSNNNGTLINGATFNSGNGGSIFTDGINQYITTPYFGSATGSFTFSTWFKNDNLSEQKILLTRGRDTRGNGWSLAITISTGGNALALITNTLGITNVVTSSNTLSINTWYYVTGLWTSGSSIKIYVNGVLRGTTNTSSTNLRTSTDGWVMGSVDASSNFTSGYTACAEIYSRALSDTEILQNYNAKKSRFGL